MELNVLGICGQLQSIAADKVCVCKHKEDRKNALFFRRFKAASSDNSSYHTHALHKYYTSSGLLTIAAS